MNIFSSDLDPVLAAQALDDKRLVKMVLETAQLLSTWMSKQGLEAPYKPTHVNHPCSKALDHEDTRAWVVRHFFALTSEYKLRYNKTHKCELVMARYPLHGLALPDRPIAPVLPNITPYKHLEVTNAYKLLLTDKWNRDRNPKWTKRNPPEWIEIAQKPSNLPRIESSF